MSGTLTIVLPVFGLVLLGYLVGRTRLLSEEGIRGINTFVFYVAIPALLFRATSRLALPDAAEAGVVLAYFSACFIVFFTACLIGRFAFALPLEEQAIMGMGATYSNGVLLGIPVILAAMGEAALFPLMLILSVHALILFTLPTVTIELARGGGGHFARIAVQAGKSLLRNPVILALVAGLGYSATGLTLTPPLASLLDMLRGAAAPTALFIVGASLTRFRIAGDLRQSLTIVGLKLFVLPAVVWVMASEVFAVPPRAVVVATVLAAMPSGVNVFLLARQFDVSVARAAATVLVSTAISVITIAALIAILGPVG